MWNLKVIFVDGLEIMHKTYTPSQWSDLPQDRSGSFRGLDYYIKYLDESQGKTRSLFIIYHYSGPTGFTNIGFQHGWFFCFMFCLFGFCILFYWQTSLLAFSPAFPTPVPQNPKLFPGPSSSSLFSISIGLFQLPGMFYFWLFTAPSPFQFPSL